MPTPTGGQPPAEKHTPGPWRMTKGSRTVSVQGPDCLIYAVTRDPLVIDETWRRQVTDARLIAAAPALLEALEAVCDSMDEWQRQYDPDHTDEESENRVRMARAALRQARGEG